MNSKKSLLGILVIVLVVAGVATALSMVPSLERPDDTTTTTAISISRPELQAELEYNDIHITGPV